MKKSLTLPLAVALASLCFAGGTKNWEHRSRTDFDKGTMKKLSLRSDGRLTLSPEFREVYDASTAYLWAVAEDRRGNVYFAGGGMDSTSSKLFVRDASGNSKVLAQLPGLEIQAIAIDAQDRVYAATSPDGKVYRVPASGEPVVFYDPKTKYIWALAFNSQGELFVATGDKGEVHKVAANGTGSVFFRTEDSHARAIAVDARGNLYAGTEPGGLVLRINPAGEGFVVYQSAKREVTSLAVAANGTVYAAAVGNKQASAPAAAPAPQPQPAPAAAPAASPDQPQAQVQVRVAAPQPAPVASRVPAVTGGSEVFRIEPDGYPKQLWTSATEIAYALALDPQGRLLIGTGNEGNIYRLDSDLLFTLLATAAPTQVTGLTAGSGGKIWAVTGNIGKLFQLGPGVESEGTYESEIMDAEFFTRWGRLSLEASLNGGTVSLATRSGNVDPPQNHWSAWQEVPLEAGGGRIASPSARFLQYRVTLRAASAGTAPVISSVTTAYLPRNVAPQVEMIEPTPANFRYPTQVISAAVNRSLVLPALGSANRSTRTASTTVQPAGTMTYAKGDIGARWLVTDENGDGIQSKLEIRGANESNWQLVKDKIDQRNVSWDSTAYPDGEYVLRVTASDSPDNPPDQAMEGSLVSAPFVIDNTPPQVTGLSATRSANGIQARWRAADQWNVLQKAEYSLDGGDWIPVEPTTGLTDSKSHDYQLNLASVAAGEHTLAIRVTDAYDNQTVEKAVVR